MKEDLLLSEANTDLLSIQGQGQLGFVVARGVPCPTRADD